MMVAEGGLGVRYCHYSTAESVRTGLITVSVTVTAKPVGQAWLFVT